MSINIIHNIQQSNAKVIIFDIDGTLKDLCEEHSIALKIVLNECNVGKVRKKIVLLINKIAMSMVKTGLFSTNNFKQSLLLRVFALLSGVKTKKFSNMYFKNYTKQIRLFEGAFELLEYLNTESQVYFSTINKQNYNLEECGILQERIVYTERKFKTTAYRTILKSIGLPKKDVIVIGDNIFDDFISAKLLGVKCIIVNNYNSKLKSLFCKLLNDKYLK